MVAHFFVSDTYVHHVLLIHYDCQSCALYSGAPYLWFNYIFFIRLMLFWGGGHPLCIEVLCWMEIMILQFLFPFLYLVLLEIDMCWLDGFLLAYRWSPDGVYFARIGGDAISVYETPVIVHLHFFLKFMVKVFVCS